MSERKTEEIVEDLKRLGPGNISTPAVMLEAATRLKYLQDWHKRRSSYDEHPLEKPHDYRFYERMPIQLSTRTVIQIQLYVGKGHMADIWYADMPDVERAHHTLYENAAKQFGLQLEGHDCIAFWQAIQKEADRRVQKWKEACAKPVENSSEG